VHATVLGGDDGQVVTDDGRGDGWAAGTQTCTVQYYNICTGWLWLWWGFSPGDRTGTAFTRCCPHGSVDSGFIYFRDAAPAGYGFTGTMAVYAADPNDCPTGAPLASRALLPVSQWNLVVWGGVPVPEDFVVLYEWPDPERPNPTAIGSDHPAAGPTGPHACGTCYPTTRTNHSYHYGTAATPLCPGSPLNDGVCDAQWLMDAGMLCAVQVEERSWGAVKSLYR